MVTKTEAKIRLLEFLDEHAFDPVLNEIPADYSGSDRENLEEVQRAVRLEQKRFHALESAERIRGTFMGEVRSPRARSMNRKLGQLQLPTLPTLQEEFLYACEKLGL